eukprot:6180328-Pleurochrysis_carterae.AAC.3
MVQNFEESFDRAVTAPTAATWLFSRKRMFELFSDRLEQIALLCNLVIARRNKVVKSQLKIYGSWSLCSASQLLKLRSRSPAKMEAMAHVRRPAMPTTFGLLMETAVMSLCTITMGLGVAFARSAASSS